SLGPGRYDTGSYVQSGRGEDFAASAAVVHGDGHAGGISTGGLRVVPLSTRCRGCSDPQPAWYEVRTVGTVALVRVYSRAVRASAFNGRAARVVEGEEA